MGSENRRRNSPIAVRLTHEERQQIEKKLDGIQNPSISAYLRHCALESGEIRARIDHESAQTLIRLSADLGRIGGLIKLFVKERDRRDSQRTIGKLLDHVEELERTRAEISHAIRHLT
ncbi:MAG: hypothetical protein KDJ38_00075 [Gammaproteobacteria bacterium]|nr:hypothetical protein [Gammaproteobacteria bacterium]